MDRAASMLFRNEQATAAADKNSVV